MEHFVTLLNSLFLPQLLALHTSMERYVKSYQLWVVCVDDESYETLSKLGLSNIKLLQLSLLETQELKNVKGTRTIGEYCWTLTPFAPLFVFDSDSEVSRVTYIDSDLWFLKDIKPIFNEFDSSGKSVLITDHAYSPEYDQSTTSGQYCVQFIIFTRDKSEPVRKWWERKCIEWCYYRVEDGKFGDQKYLDCWPIVFDNYVHVLKQKHFTLAPWNACIFPYGNAIFYHFAGVRILSKKTILVGDYVLPSVLIFNVYRPYFQDLNSSINKLLDLGWIFKPQTSKSNLIHSIYSRFAKIYRLFRAHFRSDKMNIKL